MVSAASITYLGCFDMKFRRQIEECILEIIKSYSLKGHNFMNLYCKIFKLTMKIR